MAAAALGRRRRGVQLVVHGGTRSLLRARPGVRLARRRAHRHDRPGRLRPAGLVPTGPAGAKSAAVGASHRPRARQRPGRRELTYLDPPRTTSVAVRAVTRSRCSCCRFPGSQSASSDGSHHPPPARPAPQIRKGTRRRVPPQGRPHTRDTAPQLPRLRALNCAPLRNADDVPFSRAAPKISRIPPQSAAMR